VVHGGHGWVWMAWQVGQGEVGMVGLVLAWQVGCGLSRSGMAGKACSGRVSSGWVRYGR